MRSQAKGALGMERDGLRQVRQFAPDMLHDEQSTKVDTGPVAAQVTNDSAIRLPSERTRQDTGGNSRK